MYRTQKGFTLIELIVVIVLLGILGVTALGKYQDLSGAARTSAVEGVASEMSASASVNYAASVVNATSDFSIDSTAGAEITADGAADACDDTALGELFASGVLPSNYTVTNNTTPDCSAATAGAGSTYQCTIVDTSDTTVTANATLICTGS